MLVLAKSEARLIHHISEQRGCTIDSEYLWTPNYLRRVVSGPGTVGGQAIRIEPFVAVVHGDFMVLVKVVIDLHIDLLAIGIVVRAIRQRKRPTVVSAAKPLRDRGVQSVSAIEDVRVRHGFKVLLSDA